LLFKNKKRENFKKGVDMDVNFAQTLVNGAVGVGSSCVAASIMKPTPNPPLIPGPKQQGSGKTA
jgi:hypothetical protein